MSDCALSLRYRKFQYEAQSIIADHEYRNKCPPMFIFKKVLIQFVQLRWEEDKRLSSNNNHFRRFSVKKLEQPPVLAGVCVYSALFGVYVALLNSSLLRPLPAPPQSKLSLVLRSLSPCPNSHLEGVYAPLAV